MLEKNPDNRISLSQVKVGVESVGSLSYTYMYGYFAWCLQTHAWVTSSGHDPLPSESDNYEVISVSDEEVRKSVTVIPKLETLVSRVVLQDDDRTCGSLQSVVCLQILVKSILKHKSFKNPFSTRAHAHLNVTGRSYSVPDSNSKAGGHWGVGRMSNCAMLKLNVASFLESQHCRSSFHCTNIQCGCGCGRPLLSFKYISYLVEFFSRNLTLQLRHTLPGCKIIKLSLFSWSFIILRFFVSLSLETKEVEIEYIWHKLVLKLNWAKYQIAVFSDKRTKITWLYRHMTCKITFATL